MLIQAIQDLSEFVQEMKEVRRPVMTTLDAVARTSAHMEAILLDARAGKGTVGGLLQSRAPLDAIQHSIDAVAAHIDRVGGILDHIAAAAAAAPGSMDTVQDTLSSTRSIAFQMEQGAATVQQILQQIDRALRTLRETLNNFKQGSDAVPQITRDTQAGIQEIRRGVDDIDRVVRSLQQNFLIRRNLPALPEVRAIDAGLRP